MNNVGGVLHAQGNYAAARPYYEQALEIGKEVLGTKHPHTATWLGNLAGLLEAQGDYAAAQPYYEQALESLRASIGHKHPQTASTMNNLAGVLRAQGKYANAQEYYEQALEVTKETLGPKHPQTGTALSNMGHFYQSRGNYAAARACFEQALAVAKEVLDSKHPFTAAWLTNLARLDEVQGDDDAARVNHEQALGIRQQVFGPSHPSVTDSLRSLGNLYAQASDWRRAGRYFDQHRRGAQQHVAQVMPSLNDREQLLFLNATQRSGFTESISLGLAPGQGADMAALTANWVLNGKSLTQEALAQRQLRRRAATDPGLKKMVEQLLEVESKLAVGVSKPVAAGNLDQAERRQLEFEQARLSTMITAASGSMAPDANWVELVSVRSKIPLDGVLIEIVKFTPKSFAKKPDEAKPSAAQYVAWIIPPTGGGEVEVIPLGPAEKIDAAVRTVRRAIEDSPELIRKQGEIEAQAELAGAMQPLSTLLVQPLQKSVAVREAKHLLISPDGELWLVPWAALPLPPDHTAATAVAIADRASATSQLMLERYGLQFLVSGRHLMAQAGSKRFTTTAPVMLADPNFDLTPVEAQSATKLAIAKTLPIDGLALRAVSSGFGNIPRVSRLPGTAAEAQAIAPQLAKYSGAQPIQHLGKFALEGVFKQLTRPKVLTLSTHGFFLPEQVTTSNGAGPGQSPAGVGAKSLRTTDGKQLENPLLRCGLLLAGCNRNGANAAHVADLDDGILTGLEIVGTDLRGTELVVLSACETGLGDVQNGEGVAGLRQAFQLAGAEAVVSTLWQIPDKESAQLMSQFFVHLANGQSKAEALRSAQLEMIRARRERHGAAHPLFWAAFTMTGQ